MGRRQLTPVGGPCCLFFSLSGEQVADPCGKSCLATVHAAGTSTLDKILGEKMGKFGPQQLESEFRLPFGSKNVPFGQQVRGSPELFSVF